MNNVGHINRVEEMDLKIAIVTALPDNPGAPVGGAEAVSVNLVPYHLHQPLCLRKALRDFNGCHL